MTALVAAQTLYDWLLFLHVLATMIWVGGGVMLAALGGRSSCCSSSPPGT